MASSPPQRTHPSVACTCFFFFARNAVVIIILELSSFLSFFSLFLLVASYILLFCSRADVSTVIYLFIYFLSFFRTNGEL